MTSKKEWLNQNIQYETNFYFKDVLEIIINKIYNSIYSSNLELICDYLTFKEDFIDAFYDYYINHKEITIQNCNFEIEDFDVLYGSFILNLYKEIQEITRFYNLDYFHGNKESYVDLSFFIVNHISFTTEIEVQDSDIDNEELFVEEDIL